MSKIQFETIEVAISKVKPNDDNPRILKDDKFKKLVKSIREFPQMLKIRPIVVNDEMIVLGGNMRLRACQEAGLKKIPIIKASELTEKQQREFIIKDNVGFGEWDWDILANEWSSVDLDEWGVDSWENIDDIETSDSFVLPNGEKEPFQQQTYILADIQANEIKNAISDIKLTDQYKFMETFENENSNGNALYLIISQWAEQKK